MQQLDKELFEVLKKSAGDFRLFYSDKKVHVISLIQAASVAQTWEEMARREGYKEVDLFKEELSIRARTSLTKVINKGCNTLHKKLHQSMKKPDDSFSYDIVGASPFYFTVTITATKKGGNVFKKFKEHKAAAQKQLITYINKWSKKHSNRGKKGHKLESESNQIRRKTYTKDPKTGKTMASGSNDPFIDVGHMEGSEVGSLRILAAKEFLDNWSATTSQAIAAKKKALDALKDIAQWVFDTELDFSGELEKVVKATLESSRINKASMSKGEVAGLNKALFEAMGKVKTKEGWVYSESSDSFFDMLEKTVVASIATKKLRKNPDAKIRTKVKYKQRKSSRSGPVKGKKRKIGASAVRGPTYRKVPVRRLKASPKDVKGSTAFQPLAMIGLINKELPAAVEGNMGRPRLESQTGRLAESARVTDIVTTPQGFPSIGYTYQLSPYQTFEQGGVQGSPDYDPRRLIDQSLRAVAAKFAMGRFYTRRVQ